jgi:hypothetical protein
MAAKEPVQFRLLKKKYLNKTKCSKPLDDQIHLGVYISNGKHEVCHPDDEGIYNEVRNYPASLYGVVVILTQSQISDPNYWDIYEEVKPTRH